MDEINNILVPTDGSEGSKNAAEFAGNLARKLGASITVLFVQSDEFLLEHSWGAAQFIGGTPEGMNTVEQIRESLEKSARENELTGTAEAIGELSTDVKIDFSWGHAAEEIVKYAKEHQIDHIVMGSHGRSGLKRAFLGSVSQAVANQSTCPVTIVK